MCGGLGKREAPTDLGAAKQEAHGDPSEGPQAAWGAAQRPFLAAATA